MAKNDRQEMILSLINSIPISTQSDLTTHLTDAGYNVTQATVSRDLQELRVVKILGADGEYRYAVPKDDPVATGNRQQGVLRQCLVSVDYAVNVVVIKTVTGAAQAVGHALDTCGISDVLGTIAGDDTIMMVVRSEDTAKGVCSDLKKFIV